MKLRQTKIMDYYKSVKKPIQLEEFIWRCVICREDLGEHNPRQYCGKTYCINYY